MCLRVLLYDDMDEGAITTDNYLRNGSKQSTLISQNGHKIN